MYSSTKRKAIGSRNVKFFHYRISTSTPKTNASIENTTTGSSTVVDDTSNPYFLHNGDSPITMLIASDTPLLGGKKLSIVAEINDHGFDSPKQSRIYE